MPLFPLAALVLVLMGCGGAKQESTGGQKTTEATEATGAGATSPIALSWSPQDNCVKFEPFNDTIHVGDRVNFTSSVAETVWVTVAAGLFSANDTTFVVTRGGNSTSPTALAIGNYPVTSNPAACASDELGGGPSIVVGAGDE